MKPYIVLEHVDKVFGRGAREVHAVRDVSLTVGEGELVALKGRSGSGKTTLINCIGGLDAATSGRIMIGEHEVTAMSEAQILELRRHTIAYVFQSFGLIPVLTVAENVSVPLRLERLRPKERDARVAEVLEMVDLAHHAKHLPGQLSGGQQQRVALARALVARPRLLLADEPTGQLDSETGATIMGLIGDLVRDTGMTALIATHDDALMRFADRVVEMRDGQLQSAEAPAAGTGRFPTSGAQAGPERPGRTAAAGAVAVPRAGREPSPAPGLREVSDEDAGDPGGGRHRAAPIVASALAVALLAAGGVWLATRSQHEDHATPATTTARPAAAATKQRAPLRLALPDRGRPLTYQVPPTLATAISGDYTDKQATTLTLVTTGGRPVLTEQKAGRTAAAPVALTAGPDGWWTGRTGGGIPITLQGYDPDKDLWRYLTAKAAQRNPVWLGLAQPSAPGVALEMWTVPMQPSDFVRVFLSNDAYWDTTGRPTTADAVGLGKASTQNWATFAEAPTVQGCPGMVYPASITDDNATYELKLPDLGSWKDARVELNDPTLHAGLGVPVPGSGPQDQAEVFVQLPGTTFAAVIGDETTVDPRLGIKRLTWKGASGASWTWETPTLDNRHVTSTCPQRSGGKKS